MKRLFALLLALSLLLCLAACGGGEQVANMDDNKETTANTTDAATDTTDSTQSTTEDIVSGEGTEPPATTAPTESNPNTNTPPTEGNTPTTPPTTEPKPTNPKPTEPTPTQPTPTEPTPTQPKPTEPTPTQPTPTEPKPTEPAKESKYVGYEIVNVNIPNKYICSNGQDLLTRMYGKNKAFQIGDSITIKIKMSNGSATQNGFAVESVSGCSYTISGDCIVATFDGSGGKYCLIDFNVTNSDGTIARDYIEVIVVPTSNLASSSGNLKEQFKKYAANKGLTFIQNGTDFVTKYNGGYTKDDKSKSITGTNRNGTDDYIPVPGNSDWIDDVLWLIDQYAKMGFVRWNFQLVMADGFATLAE